MGFKVRKDRNYMGKWLHISCCNLWAHQISTLDFHGHIHISRQFKALKILLVVIFMNLFVVITTQAQTEKIPARQSLTKEMPDISIGRENAPITIVEYTSLTCDHCAFFHCEVLPKIKAKYIDTGQVRLIFRHFPLDRDALKAAAVVSCFPEMKRYVAMTQLFFTQNQWMDQNSDAPLGKVIGMDLNQCQQCLKNEKIQDNVLLQRLNGQQTFKIDATPTFIVGKYIFAGVPTVDEIEKLIAKAQNP